MASEPPGWILGSVKVFEVQVRDWVANRTARRLSVRRMGGSHWVLRVVRLCKTTVRPLTRPNSHSTQARQAGRTDDPILLCRSL